MAQMNPESHQQGRLPPGAPRRPTCYGYGLCSSGAAGQGRCENRATQVCAVPSWHRIPDKCCRGGQSIVTSLWLICSTTAGSEGGLVAHGKFLAGLISAMPWELLTWLLAFILQVSGWARTAASAAQRVGLRCHCCRRQSAASHCHTGSCTNLPALCHAWSASILVQVALPLRTRCLHRLPQLERLPHPPPRAASPAPRAASRRCWAAACTS